jgi:hypothetical protein
LDVIRKAEGEISSMRLLLEPFVLNGDEIERNEQLLGSYFQMLTVQYQKVEEAGLKVTGIRLKAESVLESC